MRYLLLLSIIGLGAIGCSHGDPDPPPAVSLNPSGKPRNQEESDMTRKYEDAGAKANAQMADAAQKMRQAQGK